jgi:hypothetical protein
MKCAQAKAVGLGLALVAGQLQAADGGLGPEGPPAGTQPALLPATVRSENWAPAPVADTNLIWLPSRKPSVAPAVAGGQPGAADPVVLAVGPLGAAGGNPVSAVAEADVAPVAPTVPRVAASPARPAYLPDIPPLPIAPPAPATAAQPTAVSPTPPARPPQPLSRPPASVPVQPPRISATLPQEPAPPPRPVAPEPRPPMTRPMPVDPLPPPRPAPTPGQPAAPRLQPQPDVWGVPGLYPPPPTGQELPPAPPELMHRHGTPVPGHRGTFGSPPIRISRDYPPLLDLLTCGWLTERERVLSEPAGPATDRVFAQAEYLMWWTREANVPALATTSTLATPDAARGLGFGFLGDPTTRLLFGPGPLGDSFRHGLRVRGGAWIDDCGTCGIDGSFFFLGRRTGQTVIPSDRFPTIARPFFAPNLNAEFAEIVALPGSSVGTLVIDHSSLLWGADANLRHALCRQCDFRAELFAGYRFLSLRETVQVTEYILAVPGNPFDPAGTRTVVQDRFETRNRFNGGQVGGLVERRWGRVSADIRASVALGVTRQQLDITGFQVNAAPGQVTPDRFAGGLLAVGPNLGRFERDRFSVVPEVTVNLGYWLTPNLKAYAGYNFLYWSNVIRPGDQIDRVVDLTFVPNPPPGVAPSGLARPQVPFKQTDFWAQGVQFGLEWRW